MSASSPDPATPRVSVVVPNLDGAAWLPGCLRGLDGQVYGDFEVLIVDNGSTDGSAEASRAAGALCLAIPQREFNHGATRNRAIEATDAPSNSETTEKSDLLNITFSLDA